MRTILISGCDHAYFPLLRDLLRSLAAAGALARFSVGIMDYGLHSEQLTELQREWNVRIVKPRWRFVVPPHPSDRSALIFSSRLYLPSEFPDYDIYFWIDSDSWLQGAQVLDAFIDGAASKGCAVVVERHPRYRVKARLKWRNVKHFVRGYGVRKGLWLEAQPHINMGIFALRSDAPHWQLWCNRLAEASIRTSQIAPFDQFAFNQLVYEDAAPTAILPPEHNWICDKALPAWDPELKLLVTPDVSHKAIGFVHLAGPAAKGRRHQIRALDGAVLDTDLRFSGMKPLLNWKAAELTSLS